MITYNETFSYQYSLVEDKIVEFLVFSKNFSIGIYKKIVDNNHSKILRQYNKTKFKFSFTIFDIHEEYGKE
ncbi:hypothetical protein EB43_00380 [Enterococcus faecium]|nr:hypothetical protein EB43_00380 [Enterococcus faecium]